MEQGLVVRRGEMRAWEGVNGARVGRRLYAPGSGCGLSWFRCPLAVFL